MIEPLFNLWWSAGTRLHFNYKRESEWMGSVWLNDHPPFRCLRQQIIRTLVRNRIIT